MNYLKSLFEFLKEGFGGDQLYHYTSPKGLLNMLKDNKFYLSSDVGSNFNVRYKNMYYLSLTRNPKAELGYGRNPASRIVFNRSKLKNNYKIVPYDYFGPVGKDRKSTKDPTRYGSFGKNNKLFNHDLNHNFEYEERLFSKKDHVDNIISYIDRIDLIKYDTESSSNIERNNYINRVYELCKELGIECNIYNNMNDMTYQKNPVEVEYTDMGYYHSLGESNIYYDNLIAFLVYNPKYMENDNLYDDFEKKAKEISKKYNINYSTIGHIYSSMRQIRNRSNDIVQSLGADLHNFYKNGKKGEQRRIYGILINYMRKLKCSSLKELMDFLSAGLLPKKISNNKKDWTAKYQLAVNKDGDFKRLENNIRIEYLNPTFYFSPTWNSHDVDSEYMQDIRYKGNTGNIINYILNKYTLDMANYYLEINHGYTQEYKILPID